MTHQSQYRFSLYIHVCLKGSQNNYSNKTEVCFNEPGTENSETTQTGWFAVCTYVFVRLIESLKVVYAEDGPPPNSESTWSWKIRLSFQSVNKPAVVCLPGITTLGLNTAPQMLYKFP